MPRQSPKPPAPPPWPADTVQRRPTASLEPYTANARTHSDAQIDQIADSIRQWGWTTPVLINHQGTLIAGHGRVLAAKKLGLPDIPVMVATGWSDAQIAAYRIADNQLALNAGWDTDLLRAELEELKALDFDLGLLGFADDELAAWLAGDVETGAGGAGSLADRFGIPPFSVLNAREGWWQERKAAWIALGIQSELGRGDTASTSARVGADQQATYRTIGGRKANAIPGGAPMPLDRQAKPSQANATPGGSKMPAADYSSRQRGDGRGRAV